MKLKSGIHGIHGDHRVSFTMLISVLVLKSESTDKSTEFDDIIIVLKTVKTGHYQYLWKARKRQAKICYMDFEYDIEFQSNDSLYPECNFMAYICFTGKQKFLNK